MRSSILILALALLFFGGAEAKYSPGLEMGTGADITFSGGDIYGTALNPGMVTVGDTAQYDIDIGDYTEGVQGEAITDAIDLLMTRTGNRGGTIFIGPCLINDSDATEPIYLNHSEAASGALVIKGAGYSWNGGAQIYAPQGIVIGAFTDYADSVDLENFYLYGNSGTPENIGISCNSSGGAYRVRLRNLRVAHYDFGINMTQSWGNTYENIAIGDCDFGGLYVSGNNNVIENVATAQTATPDYYAIRVYGMGNKINCDVGIGGGEAGSKGLLLEGSRNILDSCWIEPVDIEGDRIYLINSWNNYIKVSGSDPVPPYGKITCVNSYENYIDPGWAPDLGSFVYGNFINVSFGDTSFWNHVAMNPSVQTANKGRLDRTDAEILDYGMRNMYQVPNSGYWYAGAAVFNDGGAGATQPAGWVCTVTGSPGTWKKMANLATI